MYHKSTAIITFLYGTVLMTYGLLGYYWKHSIPSLIAGLVLGVLLLGSADLLRRRNKWGMYGAFAVAAIATILLTYRFLVGWKLIPAALACLSAAVLLYFIKVRFKA